MAKQFQIGQMDRYIHLKKLQKDESGTGEDIITEVDYQYTYAHLKDVSGSEEEEGKILSLNVRKYTIRYNDEVYLNGVKMILVDDDGVYNIHSVAQIGRKAYLQLKCSKRE